MRKGPRCVGDCQFGFPDRDVIMKFCLFNKGTEDGKRLESEKKKKKNQNCYRSRRFDLCDRSQMKQSRTGDVFTLYYIDQCIGTGVLRGSVSESHLEDDGTYISVVSIITPYSPDKTMLRRKEMLE